MRNNKKLKPKKGKKASLPSKPISRPKPQKNIIKKRNSKQKI
jgi:hypothetical protein